MSERPVGQQNGWRPQPRPRFRPPRTQWDITFTTLALAGTAALLAMTVYWWPMLPATIATHFGIDGKPNAYGSKNTMFLLPAIQVVLLIFTTVLGRYPWAFNYPVAITQENAERQYLRGRLLLEGINAVISWFFVFIQWQTIQVATRATTNLGGVFSPYLLIAVLVVFPLAMLLIIVVWVARGK